jgi:hypothetical protein
MWKVREKLIRILKSMFILQAKEALVDWVKVGDRVVMEVMGMVQL